MPAFASPVNQTQLLDEKEQRNTFELTCQTGFVLRGPKVLHCIEGNWVGSEIARCVGKKRVFRRGSIAPILVCRSHGVGGMLSSIFSNIFSPLFSGKIISCLAVECHPLVPLINGQIDLFPVRGLSNNSFNSVARHRCSEGYMIFGGDVTRTCGQDARWTGTPPFCRREKIHYKK